MFLDFFFIELFWIPFELTSLTWGYKTYKELTIVHSRLTKPITSYLINLNQKLLVYNIYYRSNLSQLQALAIQSNKEDAEPFSSDTWNSVYTLKTFLDIYHT